LSKGVLSLIIKQSSETTNDQSGIACGGWCSQFSRYFLAYRSIAARVASEYDLRSIQCELC
jgi:hypothetical protein